MTGGSTIVGLDYADQRMYASTYGRFNTPDPTHQGVSASDPTSWNRYSYTEGDPVNGNDPTGLCAAFIAGITMQPGTSDFSAIAGSIGAITAFPYAGQNPVSSTASVIFQGTGPNGATGVALAAINFALSTNSGKIDIVAYSGGAAAFTDAYGELSTADQQRIGNILYLSPGAAGEIVTNGSTSVVLGSGVLDNLATIGTYIPPGTPITDSNCAHTDFACLARSAQRQLNTIQNDGSCNVPMTTYLAPNTLTGHGGGAGGGSRGWTDSRMRLLDALDPEPQPYVTETIKYGPGDTAK